MILKAYLANAINHNNNRKKTYMAFNAINSLSVDVVLKTCMHLLFPRDRPILLKLAMLNMVVFYF